MLSDRLIDSLFACSDAFRHFEGLPTSYELRLFCCQGSRAACGRWTRTELPGVQGKSAQKFCLLRRAEVLCALVRSTDLCSDGACAQHGYLDLLVVSKVVYLTYEVCLYIQALTSGLQVDKFVRRVHGCNTSYTAIE
jgi:hypothetical protein